MFSKRKIQLIAVLGFVIAILSGCSKDDEKQMPSPRSFKVTIQNVSQAYKFFASGVFNTPVGAASPGPLLPGDAYEVSFSAAPGSKLSFATMFVPSNDFFYAPGESGIELFDVSGNPVTGDITAQIQLWDAGTEVNQEPGLGADQPQRQAAANTGAADPSVQVRQAPDDFNNLPPVNQVLQATLTSSSPTRFTLRIENVSTGSTLATSDGNMQAVPLAPGVWVVHSDDSPLFMSGQPDMGQGLEALAEDGDPSMLSAYLSSNSGLTSLLAPGVWAVHSGANPIFTSGKAAGSGGLEALAEDGDPSALATTVQNAAGVQSSGVFNTPLGSAQPGPLAPMNAYEFTVNASPGDLLSFATMFVQSNDLFYAPDESGIALFEADGQPVSGDFTSSIQLWDAGTEINEEPGVGLNQAPRQSGPNTGADENSVVRLVNDAFSYPMTNEVIKVTITPQ